MSKIYLIRHGQTIWNVEGRKQGHQDSPLTIVGFNQAIAIADLLKTTEPQLDNFQWLISSLGRCKQFSALMCNQLDLDWTDCIIDKSLREYCFGPWEGKTEQEIEEQWPGQLAIRRQNWWHYKISSIADSYASLSARVTPIFSKYDNTNLVIVTHEMVSKVLRGFYKGLTNKQILELKHKQNTIYCLTKGKVEKLIV